jgi:hypothetical protein
MDGPCYRFGRDTFNFLLKAVSCHRLSVLPLADIFVPQGSEPIRLRSVYRLPRYLLRVFTPEVND